MIALSEICFLYCSKNILGFAAIFSVPFVAPSLVLFKTVASEVGEIENSFSVSALSMAARRSASSRFLSINRFSSKLYYFIKKSMLKKRNIKNKALTGLLND